MMQLLIPIANYQENAEVREEAYFKGKFLTNLSMSSFKVSYISKVIVVINRKIYLRGKIIKILKKIFDKKIKFIIVDGNTDGATCSSLLAIDQIDPKKPLVITSIDQIVKFEIKDFINQIKEEKSDAGIVCFNSTDPKWSYILSDENGTVKMLSEKRPISNIATAGVYYFTKASDFIKSSQDQILKKNTDMLNTFYLSGVYNELILQDKKITIFKIDEANFNKFEDQFSFSKYILNLDANKHRQYYKNLTIRYINHFNTNLPEVVIDSFNENSSLIEVGNDEYFGKNQILNMFKNAFRENLKLEPINIITIPEKKLTILEFELNIKKKLFVGNDIIFWKNGKIELMKAYFYEKK